MKGTPFSKIVIKAAHFFWLCLILLPLCFCESAKAQMDAPAPGELPKINFPAKAELENLEKPPIDEEKFYSFDNEYKNIHESDESTNIDHVGNIYLKSPVYQSFIVDNQMKQLQLEYTYRKILVAYTHEYYQDKIDNLEITHNAFLWNARQSVIIFFVAHFLLLIGVGAALYEFSCAMKIRAKAREKEEIKIDLEGVALKTSLRAIYLLLTALGFYFLYLKFVYPIILK